MSTPKNIVILIHGTWGLNSPWTLEGSALRRVLRETFGEECIERFRWSGWNSHQARLKASKRLAARVRRSLSSYLDAKHFVIAHSHGGNVLLYSMRDDPSIRRISGILFMGTPFMACETRDVYQSLGALPFLLSALCWVIPLFLFIGLARANRVLRISDGFFMLVSLLIAICAGGCWWFAKEHVLQSFAAWAYKRQSVTMEKIALPDCRTFNIPIFCAVAVGDEPYWLIRATRSIADLPYKFWQPAFQAVLVTAALFAVPTGILFPRVLPFLSFFTFLDFFPFFLIKVLILYAALAFLLQCLMLLLPFLTLSRYVFGGGGVESWLTYTTVTPIPPGFSQKGDRLSVIKDLHAGDERFRFTRYRVKGRGLRHSLIYESDDFLDDLKSLAQRNG